MSSTGDIIKNVCAAFERETRINLHSYPIQMDYQEDRLILTGAVGDIAAKKLMVKLAARVAEVEQVIDHLTVAPAQAMGDGAILDQMANALLRTLEFGQCTIRVSHKGRVETLRSPFDDSGLEDVIEVSADNGVITLKGQVRSLSHRRLAGVLGWWIPGSRNVENRLKIEPPERDDDNELTDAVRLVLELDPFIHDAQIFVSSKNQVVTLQGGVPTEEEKRLAENDAWFVDGVLDVHNQLELLP